MEIISVDDDTQEAIWVEDQGTSSYGGWRVIMVMVAAMMAAVALGKIM